MGKSKSYNPFIWSAALFLICFGLMFLAVSREASFIQSNQITVPKFTGESATVPGSPGLNNISEAVNIKTTGLPILYFLLMAGLIGAVLFFLPISKLWIVLKILFGFAFSWGTFVFLGFFLNAWLAGLIAVGLGVIWFIRPKIWLHNGLLILTLVSLGAVFGAMFSPWSVILVMLVIAIYDFLSVKFGYMQWMAKKLSESETLPAFFIPAKLIDWKTGINGKEVKNIFLDKGEKQFSILGGGDIFFPLWLSSTVWFASGVKITLITAVFSLIGLVTAYLIHFFIMKGKATPALPSIFLFSLIGLLVASFVAGG